MHGVADYGMLWRTTACCGGPRHVAADHGMMWWTTASRGGLQVNANYKPPISNSSSCAATFKCNYPGVYKMRLTITTGCQV